MDLDRMVPPNMRPHLLWLARVPNWLRLENRVAAQSIDPCTLRVVQHDEPLPTTATCVDWQALAQHCEYPAHRVFVQTMYQLCNNPLVAVYMETAARLLADGPKLFKPTEEQFEGMEHVEARLPPRDFRSPYPAMLVRIPPLCRRRLCDAAGRSHDWIHPNVLVGYREVSGQPLGIIVTIGLSGHQEQHFQFTDQPGNPTIEVVLRRAIVNGRVVDMTADPENVVLATVARACLNLCLMLTHYGHRVAGPADPAAYAKHRRKKHLAHFAVADCSAVELVQNIVVRGPSRPTTNPPGPGSGVEVKPHWVRGHWRAYPGQAAARARGERVPLLFIRPYVVRSDRLVGDLADTSVTYHGA